VVKPYVDESSDNCVSTSAVIVVDEAQIARDELDVLAKNVLSITKYLKAGFDLGLKPGGDVTNIRDYFRIDNWWSGDIKISAYKTEADYNPTGRPWYTSAVESGGITWSPVFVARCLQWCCHHRDLRPLLRRQWRPSGRRGG